ncbi:MAG: 4-hydroxy-tetrahydrodipicolinate synthase [Firmicutes bacterium]|nr:4-hydroxy-tetrahydrodipicolinate synthase [Bacillota bacterium]
MSLFQGAATALVTPFRDGKPDFEALGRLIDFQLKNNIDALVSCGTTGEASTLSLEEQIQVVQFTINRVNHRVPVIAGAGSNDTQVALTKAKAMEYAGADGILMVTPYYNKCSQKGLIQHYTYIADQLKSPMILYSVQSRTGVNIAPETVGVLARHPNICGIKEASGNISQIVEISKYVNNGFAMYSGNDDQVIPLMSMGGSGVISTCGNVIPKEMHDMTQAWFDGDLKTAAGLQREYKALIDALFCEVNPIPVKAALWLMEMIQLEYRLPLCPPSEATVNRLKEVLQGYGIASFQ